MILTFYDKWPKLGQNNDNIFLVKQDPELWYANSLIICYINP